MRAEKIKVLPHTGGRTIFYKPKDNLTKIPGLVKSKNSKIKIPGKAPGNNPFGRLQPTGTDCGISCLNSSLGDCGGIISNYPGLVKYFSSQSGLFSGAGAPVSHLGCAQGKETGGERVNPLSPGFFEKTGGDGGSSPSVGDINLIIDQAPTLDTEQHEHIEQHKEIENQIDQEWEWFKDDLKEIFKRSKILKMRLTEIFHEYSRVVDDFHKRFGLFEGSWSSQVEKHKKEERRYRVLRFRREKDKRRNLYDSIQYVHEYTRRFKRLEKVLEEENQRGFFMAVFTIHREISVEEMKKLRRSLSRLLKRHKFKHFAIIFHHWGDKNLFSEHPHFHVIGVSRKLYLSQEELEELKKSWGKILNYQGEVEITQEKIEKEKEDMEIEKKDCPVVWWGYTYSKAVAKHFYLYSMRPYLLDVFVCYAVEGENGIDEEAFYKKLDKWERKRLKRVELYGGLREKVSGEEFNEEEAEWEVVKDIYCVHEEGKIYRDGEYYWVYSYYQGDAGMPWMDDKYFCIVKADGEIIEDKLRENPLEKNGVNLGCNTYLYTGVYTGVIHRKKPGET